MKENQTQRSQTTSNQTDSSNLYGTLGTVVALLAGFGLMQMGNTLQGTLLSVRGGMESFSATEIGLIGSGFSAGLVLGSLWAGTLIRTVGQTRTFAALASLASTAALLHLMFVDPILWVVFRTMTGFCFAGLFMSVESWLNGAATAGVRGQILGLYSMTGLMAGVAGQMLLPVADPAGFTLFCMASVIISVALVPVALSRSTAPNLGEEQAGLDLRRLYRQSPFGLVAAFLCGITSGSFFALGPYYAQQLEFTQTGIAIFMACATLGAFATTWPFGWISDRMDRRLLVILIALGSFLILGATILTVPDRMPPLVVYGLVFVFGGLVLPTYSIVVAHVNDAVSPKEFVAASGGLLIVQGTGMATGPILGGFAMSTLGNDGLPWLIVAAQGGIALWGAYRMTRRAAPAEQEQFQPVPITQVGTQLIDATQQAS